MVNMTNKDSLISDQYKDSKNLDVRSYLHSKFSTNKYGWGKWIFDQLIIEDNAKILELGCGNGKLWSSNSGRIRTGWDITLSDFSTGMIAKAKSNINNDNFKYMQIDAEVIPFEDNSFDVIIANHMLYHLPNRNKALLEIRRVLKDGGRFFATTLGVNNVFELEQLVNSIDQSLNYPKTAEQINFNLENGENELSKYFSNVEIRRYEDSLTVTESKPLVDYILTITGTIDGKKLEDLSMYIEKSIKEKGSIHITKDAGMFIAY